MFWNLCIGRSCWRELCLGFRRATSTVATSSINQWAFDYVHSYSCAVELAHAWFTTLLAHRGYRRQCRCHAKVAIFPIPSLGCVATSLSSELHGGHYRGTILCDSVHISSCALRTI